MFLSLSLLKILPSLRNSAMKGILLVLSTALCFFAWGAVDGEKGDTIPISALAPIQPPSADLRMKALRAGVDFLLKEQNADGSWGSRALKGPTPILCPSVEGAAAFKIATLSLCLIGLQETPMRDEPAVQEALRKGYAYLVERLPMVKRGDSLTILSNWGHSYALAALSKRAEGWEKGSPEWNKFRALVQEQIRLLTLNASVHGGWGYYDFESLKRVPDGWPTPFITSTAFIALNEVKKVFGLSLDHDVYQRALNFLISCRNPSGNYIYASMHRKHPTGLINRHMGSLGRNTSGNLALEICQPDLLNEKQMEEGLNRLWAKSRWMTTVIKRPKPHEGLAQVAGYFYYYAYYYAARSLALVPNEKQAYHAAFIARDLMAEQSDDGSWWDFPLYNYHKFYGTGYALYALSVANKLLP